MVSSVFYEESLCCEVSPKLCLFLLSLPGLIAASSGQLDSLLNESGHGSKPIMNGVINGISNGKATPKAQQNGNCFKPMNGSLNGVYTNGNGVHH